MNTLRPCPECRQVVHSDICPTNADRWFWGALATIVFLVGLAVLW